MINGFFILVENQFEVGDTIKAAGVSGTVEEITMRRTLLRDGDGTLHIVPNGCHQIVSNTTRDWSQVNMHVAADYSENSDRVVEVLNEVAKKSITIRLSRMMWWRNRRSPALSGSAGMKWIT